MFVCRLDRIDEGEYLRNIHVYNTLQSARPMYHTGNSIRDIPDCLVSGAIHAVTARLLDQANMCLASADFSRYHFFHQQAFFSCFSGLFSAVGNAISTMAPESDCASDIL